VDAELPAGDHTVVWRADRGSTGAGAYFARMVAGSKQIARRIIVLE
jgi:hypothetical protein